jgi:hypothetical protein
LVPYSIHVPTIPRRKGRPPGGGKLWVSDEVAGGEDIIGQDGGGGWFVGTEVGANM